MKARSRASVGGNRENRFLLWYLDFQKEHWIWHMLLCQLPALWFSLILVYLGDSLYLIHVTDNGHVHLTWVGLLGSVVVLALTFAIKIFDRYAQRYDTNEDTAMLALLDNTRTTLNDACGAKLRPLVSQIYAIKKEHAEADVEIVGNPLYQLQELSKDMSKCLYETLYISKKCRWTADDLYVSIAYQFPCESTEWHWATEEKGLGFTELLATTSDGSCSTFRYLLSSKKNFYLINNKQKGLKEKQYIADSIDGKYSDDDLAGSIACYKDSIKKNDIEFVRFVVTVSTYSRRFDPDDNARTVSTLRHNMSGIIVADFVERIKIELCMLYLNNLGAEAGESVT